jgi:hypothetical protein
VSTQQRLQLRLNITELINAIQPVKILWVEWSFSFSAC